MSEYRILFVGDFYHGEGYPRVKREILDRHGYRYATAYLEPFLDSVDCRILNLETPIVSPEDVPSPFKDNKSYVHWSDPDVVPQVLADLDIDAVSLANNHTLDHGKEGLSQTINYLDEVGIKVFGAGQDIDQAAAPYRIALPSQIGGAVSIFGFYEYRSKYDTEFSFYAGSDTPGCNPLHDSLDQMHPLDISENDVNVAFPHWGANYRWPRGRQLRQRRSLANAGFDLVLGHGSHCLQGFTVRNRVPIFYGIGNGVFQSPGRFRKYQNEYGILPYGAWAILSFQRGKLATGFNLRLYPVYANNRESGFQPRPVEEEDFRKIVDVLASDMPRMQAEGIQIFEDRDSLGFHLRVELGDR